MNKAERAFGVVLSVGVLSWLAFRHQRGGLHVVPFAYVVALCLVTFLTYGYDKFCAATKRDRVSEMTLFCWTLGGGWPAAFIAQEVFRHKTTKFTFRLRHWSAVLVNITLVWLLVRIL